MPLQFEWDIIKARKNLRKHAVDFAEAMKVFLDPLARIHDDLEHSEDELREIIVGHSGAGRVLVVCFTERMPNTIRIFSARPATKREKADYEENNS